EDVEQPGTEYADVAELLQIRQRDVERLIAAHREPRDCAVFAAGENAVILFDIRHDVGHEILNELVRRRRAAAWLSDSRQWPPSKWSRVSGGHHDNHWFGFFSRYQIVENEAGAPDRGPRIVTIARAVQQVKDGELTLPRFIARRRVNMHAAELA